MTTIATDGRSADDLDWGYAGHPGAWHGVIRRGHVVAWTCPHDHTNRDHTTTREVAATSCARDVLYAATHPETRWAMAAFDDPRRAQYLHRVIFPLADQLAASLGASR
jgi:hypothetical protein